MTSGEPPDPLAGVHAASWELLRQVAVDHPGMPEALEQAMVVIASARLSQAAHYAPDRWICGGRYADEIGLNAHLLDAGIEEVADSLIHELVHAWGHALGVRQTSRNGRYHNRSFRAAAELLLRVEKDPLNGCRTVGLQPATWERYARPLAELDRALVIVRRHAMTAQPETSDTDREDDTDGDRRYLSVTCACRRCGRFRTIRVARGWWEPDSITCETCGEPFA